MAVERSKEEMNEPVTIIGTNTVVSGNIEGDENLTIEGRIEGSINLPRTLTIENNGVVHANVNVKNAVISGVLVGNVQAEELVHVTDEGRVVGDINAPRVILVDGASFRGNVDMGEFDVGRSESTSARSRPVVERAKPFSEETREPSAERAPTRIAAQPAKPSRAPASKQVKRTPPAKKKKSAPEPKIRTVGKSKAVKKKRR